MRPLTGRLAPCVAIALAIAAAVPSVQSVAAEDRTSSAGAAPTIRLMSRSQYLNAVEATFGAGFISTVRFAPVKRTDGLVAVGSSAAVMTPGALDPLDSAARSIAQQVVAPRNREFLIPCKPAVADAPDEACTRTFLSRVGRMLYRRPLTEAELAEKVRLAAQATQQASDYYYGLETAVSAMLVSPNFLLIRERIEPDPERKGEWRLDGYSKASRLSYFLWDSAPDAELLNAASRGELHDPKGLQEQLDRMLASPLYARGVRAFFTDFLVLENYDNVVKDPIIYPAYNMKVATDAREQLLRTIEDHLVARKGDYRDLFTTRRTVLTSSLASIYRVPVEAGMAEWKPYEFPEGDARAGLLTQAAFLAQYAHPGRSSPTRRGKGVREVFLCQHVPDPPPTVDFSIIEDPNAVFHTARERLVAHNTDPVCRGCHMLTDPIGLTLENFDGAGQYRTTEKGAVIDPTGNLGGITYNDAAGLGRAVRDNPAVRSCIVRRLYAYGVGRELTPEETKVTKQMPEFLDQRGYRFDEMIKVIVSSDTFFAVKAPQSLITAQTEGSRHAH